MKFMYVRGERKNVIPGLVTDLRHVTGIVLLDDNHGSARFDLRVCCKVSLGEGGWDGDHGIKFSQTIKVDRPVPYSGDPRNFSRKSRIVVILDNRNPEWAYLWAYEDEYNEVCARADGIKRAYEEGVRNAQIARHAAEVRKVQARSILNSLGFFRVAQAHKFDQKPTPEPTKAATGPMKLCGLMSDIRTGKIPFVSSQKRGQNDTLMMWFERQTEGGWKKVDITLEEGLLVADVYDGEANLDSVQPLIDRINGLMTGVAPSQLVATA